MKFQSDTITIPTELSFTKTLADGTNETGTCEVTDGLCEFTLAHKESITFDGVSVGLTYEVIEVDGESDGYTVTSENASGIVTDDTDCQFINHKSAGVPTGVHTNTVLMLVLSLLTGIVMLILRKRYFA